MSSSVDIEEFAERVERICDFFLDKTVRDGTADVTVLQKLKEDAVKIQSTNMSFIDGLDNYMRGFPGPPKE